MGFTFDTDFITLKASQLVRIIGTLILPAGCVKNDTIAADAAIVVEKMVHQHVQRYSQPNTTATTETRVLHVTRGATGKLIEFVAGSIGVCTSPATVTLDLRKNGTTVLTSPITLNSSNVARVAVTGLISVDTLAEGNVLEVVITATAGGGTLATGVFCEAIVNEQPVLDT